MIRIDSRQPLPADLRGAIIALGNFDGFHLGHQAVVSEAVNWAKAEGRPCIVATFDPHPVEFFTSNPAPFRLTSLDQREALFAKAGADAMLVFAFDAAMAASSATDWIEGVLAGHLGAGGVVTGEDFTFGKGREGTTASLATRGASVGLRARAVAAVALDGETVSSSRIRQALRGGDLAQAERLLSRPFAVEGLVQHGDKVGRTIGFPTANLDMGAYLRPAYGIYAVSARLQDGRRLLGAANLGIRPHFSPPKELLEPHFFDFSGDLYGLRIAVAFHAFLRGEEKFASLDALTAQIAQDCAKARGLLQQIA
jgi:riboflavin kinase/FMN adenylyltransferase